MGLKIIISSAVVLEEKKCVKEKLYEMRKQHIINFEDKDLYDCNEHGTFWNDVSKQEIINRFIANADWFICLAPHYTVGEATGGELEYVLKRKLEGAPIAISVFHPLDISDEEKKMPIKNAQISFDHMKQQAQQLFGMSDVPYFEDYTGGTEGLVNKIESVYKKAYHNDKAFWSQHVGYYTQYGKDIEARRLFFDEKRASLEWGFREGSENYIWRNSVDGKLNQKLDKYGAKFLFITGKPTSGKSRALYECLHSTLKDKNIVVLKSENIVQICQNLEIEKEQYGKYNGLPQRFEDNEYFFVCDQIADVFKLARVPQELRLSFLRIIAEHDNCKLLATGTPKSLDAFVEESDGVISPFDSLSEGGNSDIITIPSLSKDIDSSEILAILRQKYAILNGETMGDFIKELNSQKLKIVDDIHKEIKKNPFLPQLLKSIQLVLVYRHNTSLLLAITILRKFYPHVDMTEFKNRTIDCLNFLIRKNVLKLSDTEYEEKEILHFPVKHFSESEYCVSTLVDDEEYPKIVSETYTFSVNEFVWEYLEEHSKSNSESSIIYNLYNALDLENAMPMLFESYPHAPTLRRIVSRVPIQWEYSDKQGDEMRRQLAWHFAQIKLSKLDSSLESKAELCQAMNILIGRAETIAQVNDILDLMTQMNVEIDDSTIGEMYSFALKRLPKDKKEFHDFIEKTDQLNKHQQERDYKRGKAWTYTDFYRVSRQIRLFSDNYGQAYNLVFDVLFNLTHVDANGNILKKKDAVKYISEQKNTKEKENLDNMMSALARLCKTEEDVRRLIQCHLNYDIKPTTMILHCIAMIMNNAISAESIIDTILPTYNDKIEKRDYYELMTVCFVMHMPNFSQSKRLYQRWHKDMKLGRKHNSRLISLCLKNCRREEFQSALSFINRIPHDVINTFTYNLLISLAPNPEDAIYIVNLMKPSDVDEYTLSNCLKCIDTVRQMNIGKKDAYISDMQIFLMAYEIINHPKLKAMRTRPSCLQKLYKLTCDKYQEEYISRIIGPEKSSLLLYNNYINSTRIMRRFYNFSDAYEKIYMPVIDAYNEMQGEFKPDLFCSMCAKYYKDKNIKSQQNAPLYIERLRKDIKRFVGGKRGGKIICDENFFLNYYVKFLGEPLFSEDDKEMSSLFQDWFFGKEGNYDPNNLSILARYIDYFNNLEISEENKWQKSVTLYSFYNQYFSDRKKVFSPMDIVFVNMLKIAEKCNNKDECFGFIDQELERLSIERTIRLNYYLHVNESDYHFKYNDSHPQPQNRHIENIVEIKKSKVSQQVLNVLEKEIREEGIITPSILNCALSKYWQFNHSRIQYYTIDDFIKYSKGILGQKPSHFNLYYLANSYLKNNKNKENSESDIVIECIKKYKSKAKNWHQLNKELEKLCIKLNDEHFAEILEFIESNHLAASLNCRGLVYLALLTNDYQIRKQRLSGLEHAIDISEKAYGMLATESITAQTNMHVSRYYFNKWLNIFKDIYEDDSVIASVLPKEKWSTLGIHLKHEISLLEKIFFDRGFTKPEQIPDFFAKLKEIGALEVLETISAIMHFYFYSPDHCNMNNFPKVMTFDNVILLLSLYESGERCWNELSTKLHSMKHNKETHINILHE